MAATNPKQYFSICRVVMYDTATRELFGPPIRVLQSTSFSSDRELIENVGGCSAYPYSIAAGRSTAEGSVAFNELSPWMLAKMAGGSVQINGAETGGNVSALEDTVGDSMTDVLTGIEVSIKSGSETELKFGAYNVVAKTADTVDVFLSTTSLDDTMVIAEDLDVSALAEVVGFGLELTAVGATDLVVGDSAMFDVRPINSGSSVSVIGGSSSTIPEVGMKMYAPNQDGNIIEIDIYRAKFAGLPINMTSNEFMTFEASFKAFYDAARDGVFTVTTVEGV